MSKLTENYIVAYRTFKDYIPISIFIDGDIIDESFPVLNEWDAINMVLQFCNPADREVVAKKTILDYEAYKDDLDNITLGMIKALD